MAPRASNYNALRHKSMKFKVKCQADTRCMAQLQPRNQALGVPQNGAHDSKPEGSRLTTNAIWGAEAPPHTLRRNGPLQLRRPAAGSCSHAEWSEWPAVGLAEARARARKAREVLDEGIDPRKAGIIKRASARTESPVRHAPGSDSHTV
jgi:hypothetical protein